MSKFTFGLFWFALFLTTSIALYNISNRAHALSEELRGLNAKIEAEQANIHVLKAEWAYLATPAKIQAAAKKHLNLQPTAVKQVVALNDLADRLPTRNEAMAGVTVSGKPLASIASLPAAAARTGAYKVAANDGNHVNIRMIIQQTAARRLPDEGRILLANFGTHP